MKIDCCVNTIHINRIFFIYNVENSLGGCVYTHSYNVHTFVMDMRRDVREKYDNVACIFDLFQRTRNDVATMTLCESSEEKTSLIKITGKLSALRCDTCNKSIHIILNQQYHVILILLMYDYFGIFCFQCVF